MKILHKFVVEIEKDVSKTEVKNEGGQEITVKTVVKEKVPYTFVMKKLARQENDDLRLFCGQQMRRATDKGLHTKATLLNKHIDAAGSLMSAETSKLAAKLTKDISELSSQIQAMGVVPENDEAASDKQLELFGKLLDARKQLEIIESSTQTLFQNTAETYIQERANLWLIFNQTYLEVAPNKYESFFKGKTFEEKESFYFDLDDNEDALYVAARNKIVLYWGLYSLNQANTPEDFAKIDERLKADEAEALQEKIDLEKEAADLKAKEVASKEPAVAVT